MKQKTAGIKSLYHKCMHILQVYFVYHQHLFLTVKPLLFYRYASSKGIRRARIEFKRRKAQFMLYTERIHFYRRLVAA